MSQKIQFWGFNEENSDAPPYNKASQGRANPAGISYLYASEEIETAISEIHPIIGQIVSVAKIQTSKELKIFDFDYYNAFINAKIMEKSAHKASEQLDISFGKLKVLFDTLAELFSRPVLGDTDDYYATQYISECIKDLGFEGIKFKSSLKKDGFNYVLFDTSKDDKGNPKNYNILCSSLHRIENVEVSQKKLLPKEKPENA